MDGGEPVHGKRTGWFPPWHRSCCCVHLAGRLDAIDEDLAAIDRKLETTMGALEDLQAADTALQQEVATFLSDIAARLANSPDPAAVEAVVADINAQVTALQGGDPANPPAPSGS